MNKKSSKRSRSQNLWERLFGKYLIRILLSPDKGLFLLIMSSTRSQRVVKVGLFLVSWCTLPRKQIFQTRFPSFPLYPFILKNKSDK